MDKVTRITIGLSPSTLERLDQICASTGIKRPAAIAVAIEKMWKEGYSDTKK